MQFAIRTSKASRPRRTPGTALPVRKVARVQAVTCLAQLALPRQAGNTQGGAATALNLHSPAVTGPPPTTQSPSTNKCETFLSQRSFFSFCARAWKWALYLVSWPRCRPGSTFTPERRGRPCPRWRPALSAWSTFAAAIRCTSRGSPPLFRLPQSVCPCEKYACCCWLTSCYVRESGG